MLEQNYWRKLVIESSNLFKVHECNYAVVDVRVEDTYCLRNYTNNRIQNNPFNRVVGLPSHIDRKLFLKTNNGIKNPEEKFSGILVLKQLVLLLVNSFCLHFSK